MFYAAPINTGRDSSFPLVTQNDIFQQSFAVVVQRFDFTQHDVIPSACPTMSFRLGVEESKASEGVICNYFHEQSMINIRSWGGVIMPEEKDKKKKKQKQKQKQNEYETLLSNYGKEVPPQEAKQALYDSQIKNMSLSIATIIQSSEDGTVLDIGCGKGIMLERLVGINSYKNRNWEYLGVDTAGGKKEIKHLAVDLEIDERTKFLSFEEFYPEEVKLRGNYSPPFLILVRNVFHELDINRTSALVHKLISIMTDDDTLFIQDLQVFPELERDHACWQPEFFSKMLTTCGFDCHFIEEPTAKGNLWFTLQAARIREQYPKIEQVKAVVLQYRKEQLKQWEEISNKLEKDQGPRNIQIALVDLDLQELALRKQIEAVEETVHDVHDNTISTALIIPDAYHRWIVDHCRYMDLKNLMPKGKAVRVELPELFISLYTNPMDKGERTDKSGHDLKEEEQKPVDIESLIVENDYLLIEGQAGSGKTTLLKHAAYNIINQEFDESLNGYLPIMIFLKEIQGQLGNRGNKVASDITAEDILKDYFVPTGLTIDTIKAYCKAGKAIFLVDGLDEIDSGNRESVIKALAQFRNKYVGCKMILSGRPHGIDNVAHNLFGDKFVRIHPLIKSQIDTFIKRWFRFVYSKGTEIGTKRAEEMIGEIETHSVINELTETPLMLTAICILYYDGRRLPDQRAELYNKFVDSLIYKRYTDPEKVSNFLNELAFEVHSTGRRGFNSDDALKVLGHHYIKREKEENDEEYQQRIEDNKLELNKQFEGIEQNCGLIKLENGKYDFWHLTIQEFLTARYIATMKFDYGKEIENYWDNDWYKEVIRLLISFLSLKNQGWANKIAEDQLNDKDSVPFKRWRLASSALWDVHEDNRNDDVVDMARNRLISIFDSEAAPEIKVDAGETLGWLGDKRDLKEFISVEGGEYYLKSVEKKVNIKPFEISKYPVTNSWYEEFVKDTKTRQPRYWNERKWKCPNSPVVGVSWHEAEAFAEWLTAKRNDGNAYRLPEENEWEAAAGGNKGRIYPWGDKWDENRCNNGEIDINKTSPVGIFKSGNTPEGISDLSGNVWEWCMDSYEKDSLYRVLRGGSWYDPEQRCRSAYRSCNPPEYRDSAIGFRLVFVP
jgi:hypothetical protein